MNKIEAVRQLMSGECDAILHGASEFILHGEDVVNKRSKKALDMKRMLEEGWDTKLLPRWDDILKSGEEHHILCILEPDDTPIIICKMTEDGDYVTSYGEVFNKDSYSQLRPATKEEAWALVYSEKDVSAPRLKKKTPIKIEDIPRPAAIVGETDTNQTDPRQIDLEAELPVAQDHPEAELGDSANVPDIDLCDPSSESTVDVSTPFDPDPAPVATAPTQLARARKSVPKEEACQVKKLKTTVMPKEETIDDNIGKDRYVGIGLNVKWWADFKAFYEDQEIDVIAELPKGDGHCSGLVIDYSVFRRKEGAKTPAKKVTNKVAKAKHNHETDDQIINKLEVFVDFGLDSEDALAFYHFYGYDKYRLSEIISDASDEDVAILVQQFYDEEK